jgi:hypothetical protein
VAFLVERFLVLDHNFPDLHALWRIMLPGLPFGPVFLLASLVEATAFATIVAFMPALTAAVYFSVRPKPRLIVRV